MMASYKPDPPSVALKIFIVLVLSLHQSAAADVTVDEEVCNKLFDTFCKAGRRETNREVIQSLDWGTDTAEQTDVLEGVCNLLVLYDLSESLQETSVVHVYSSTLLKDNLREACSWLYRDCDIDPDCECEDSLRFFCFWNATKPINLIKFLDNGCDPPSGCI